MMKMTLLLWMILSVVKVSIQEGKSMLKQCTFVPLIMVCTTFTPQMKRKASSYITNCTCAGMLNEILYTVYLVKVVCILFCCCEYVFS